MKIPNFLFTVFFITALALLYTHQRIEAVTLSYEINKKMDALDKLLDQKKELEYNVAKLNAPTYLELQLAREDIKLVLPERWEVFEVAGLKKKKETSPLPLFVRNFKNLFSLREAQATPAAE